MTAAPGSTYPLPGDAVPGAPPPLRGWPTDRSGSAPASESASVSESESANPEPPGEGASPASGGAGLDPQFRSGAARWAGGSGWLWFPLAGVALAGGGLLVRGLRRRLRDIDHSAGTAP